MEHPRIVKKLEEIHICSDGEMGYWISKKWLKGAAVRPLSLIVPSFSDLCHARFQIK